MGISADRAISMFAKYLKDSGHEVACGIVERRQRPDHEPPVLQAPDVLPVRAVLLRQHAHPFSLRVPSTTVTNARRTPRGSIRTASVGKCLGRSIAVPAISCTQIEGRVTGAARPRIVLRNVGPCAQ